MNMDQAAVFLASSILVAISVITLIAAAVAINNLLHRYWKPVRMFTTDSFNLNSPRFAEPHELSTRKEPKVK